MLDRAVNRAERVAAKNPRQGKQAKVDAAKQEQSDLLGAASGRAAAAGSNLTSGVAEVVDETTTNPNPTQRR